MSPEPTPWDSAYEAAEGAGVTLRHLDRPRDTDAVSTIIERVWGGQVMLPELLRAFQHAGVVLIGAEREGQLVGFVLGFYGMAGGLHHHSHQLAVLPEVRSRGAGYALKLAQRADCLESGVDEVRWTYDPLVARNGYFNLVKLGAEAIAFYREFYGPMRDALNRGDRSDRFEVRWRLRSGRVRRALAGEAREPARGAPVLDAAGEPGLERPVPAEATPAPGALVRVPRDHLALRTADPVLGEQWRDRSAATFEACFGAGLVATWMGRDSTYVFEPASALEAGG